MVVDELHMVGDGGRGLALETSLTKLLFHPQAQGLQIIGMSATAGGLDTLAAWLRARLFMTNFRPVPLVEHAVFAGTIFELVRPFWQCKHHTCLAVSEHCWHLKGSSSPDSLLAADHTLTGHYFACIAQIRGLCSIAEFSRPEVMLH